MRKMIVHLSVGFAGMDAYEALLVEDDATEDEIAQEAWHMALDHAERYGYYPTDDYSEDGEDEDDGGWDRDHYSHNIEGCAEDYDPDRHDMKRAGGGSFELDFAGMM
jgi:hypothetical protein